MEIKRVCHQNLFDGTSNLPLKREICTFILIPLCSPKEASFPTAIALGSFDGLHAGHRKVIKSITATNLGIPTVVSFWPHPREVLFGESRLRLDLPTEKTSLLEPLGIKQLVLVPFDNELAKLSAETFVKEILHKTLQAKVIGVGENFRFGHNRQGDTLILEKIAASLGIKVNVMPIIKDSKGRMSSSRVRAALHHGDLQAAKELLNRPYNFRGIVIRGKGLGQKLGWPTANLQINGRKFLPGEGVYAAWAYENHQNTKYRAIMNLGPQPTIDPSSPSSVEVHLLNQKVELLGKELIIEPIEKIRTQIKFPNIEDLIKQIEKDAKKAQYIFQNL